MPETSPALQWRRGSELNSACWNGVVGVLGGVKGHHRLMFNFGKHMGCHLYYRNRSNNRHGKMLLTEEQTHT